MQTQIQPPSEAVAPGATPSIWWGRAAGLVAGLAGLAIADLAAWVVAPGGAPVPVVGTAIIDILPAGLVNWGKETLGHADKPILLGVITVAVVVLAGLAGQLERSRPYAGLAVFVPLAAVGWVATATAPDFGVGNLLPIALGLGLGYLILFHLVRRLRQVPAGAGPGSADRRSFLGLTILVGSLAAVGLLGARLLSRAASAVADARSRFNPSTPTSEVTVPAGADLRIEGLSPYVTPNDDFYRIDTALQVPTIDPDTWSLRVSGLVDQAIELSYADLLAKPLVEHAATLACVSNNIGGDLIGNAVWLGWPIRELLAQAGPQAGADMVLSVSKDGWTAGTPLEVLTDPERQALLAVGMNGDPLPIEHGYPVRMVVPGLYGYVSATKWVTELRVTTFAADEGYWTPRGWSALGPIKLCSRIDVPRRGSVGAGRVAVAGVAWAQHTGIGKVEVGVDGEWHEARLAGAVGPDTWRQWVFEWDATPGRHELVVRATDADGKLQVEQSASPAPNGATGWHTISVDVS